MTKSSKHSYFLSRSERLDSISPKNINSLHEQYTKTESGPTDYSYTAKFQLTCATHVMCNTFGNNINNFYCKSLSSNISSRPNLILRSSRSNNFSPSDKIPSSTNNFSTISSSLPIILPFFAFR